MLTGDYVSTFSSLPPIGGRKSPAAEGAVVDADVGVSPARAGADEVFGFDLVHDSAIVNPVFWPVEKHALFDPGSQLVATKHGYRLLKRQRVVERWGPDNMLISKHAEGIKPLPL